MAGRIRARTLVTRPIRYYMRRSTPVSASEATPQRSVGVGTHQRRSGTHSLASSAEPSHQVGLSNIVYCGLNSDDSPLIGQVLK